MTIEIANRLVKLRKEKGLSQEELADKLGLSRQAVSKWERAEASPDTDNLICLAKLYGVSLDELLTSDDDIETIVNEQVKKDETEKEQKEDKDDDSTIEFEGNDEKSHTKRIVINDGKDKVVINIDKKIAKHIDKWKNNKLLKIAGIIEGSLFVLATIAYILLGCFVPSGWAWGWIVFFVPEILCSIIRAIAKKQLTEFNAAFLAIFSYFFFTMAVPMAIAPDTTALWHPLWVIFLAIPLYYIPASAIDKALGHSDDCDVKCSKCCSDEKEDNND